MIICGSPDLHIQRNQETQYKGNFVFLLCSYLFPSSPLTSIYLTGDRGTLPLNLLWTCFSIFLIASYWAFLSLIYHMVMDQNDPYPKKSDQPIGLTQLWIFQQNYGSYFFWTRVSKIVDSSDERVENIPILYLSVHFFLVK